MITSTLEDFTPITLDEMDKVRLMNRIDTKYVTTYDSLMLFLSRNPSEYRVVEIGGLRLLPYSTCYFDTPDCEMFYQHERGRAARQKVRMRVYENTGASFLEVKRKNNKGRTDKKRVEAPYKGDISGYSGFIRKYSVYDSADLMPRLENHFHRITLVNEPMTERLTIDIGLRFHNLTTLASRTLDSLVIIELKRGGNTYSHTAEILHSLHIHPSGFSKYCIGTAMTNVSLRQNRIKPKIRMVERMLSQDKDGAFCKPF